MSYLVRHVDVIFNLAGQVSHIDSMRDPYTDLEINCRSQLSILEACRRNNPGIKVVFAGTRQVYGKPEFLPVTEQHLVRPTDVNGINKVAGEYYHLVYNNVFGVRACSLRLTNIYGPRQLVKHNRQGFIGWFIRLAVEGREIADLRRRLAAARLRVRRRCGRRVPESGSVRRLQRRGVQRRRRRAREPSRPGAPPARGGRHRAASATWSGRRRRRPSTSAASTPTPRSSGPPPAGSRASRCARGSPGPWPTTGSTWPTTSTRSTPDRPHHDHTPRPVHAPGPRGRPSGHRRRHPACRRSRLVRARARGRRLRAGASPARAARRTPSASARAPTRSPSSCAGSGSAPATR